MIHPEFDSTEDSEQVPSIEIAAPDASIAVTAASTSKTGGPPSPSGYGSPLAVSLTPASLQRRGSNFDMEKKP